MATYEYTIRLTSDAEPGTGLGGETINELVPRDARGCPVLAGSHIKGLMRDALGGMAQELWHPDVSQELSPPGILETVFGAVDEKSLDADSLLRVGPATATLETDVHTVTRTSVGEAGVALDRSLRTTEVVPVGTVYQGKIHSAAPPGSPFELAWRLALLAIPAVGGSRNRGCGACIVELKDETRTPGELLKLLDEHLQQRGNKLDRPARIAASASTPISLDDAPPVVLRLVFYADTPICCPEITAKTNVISTGFSIPASAVQGMLLTRINAEDPTLATAIFASRHFRAWPLLPCGLPSSDKKLPDAGKLPIPIRVSLTHRLAKFTLGDKLLPPEAFQDEAIEPYDWTQTVNGAPLKATDGVLLRRGDQPVEIWTARSMPHVVTSHGVHHDPNEPEGRNLYTVDAMAPLVWQGLVVLPAAAAERVLDLLRRDPIVGLGKSRTVRGFGHLDASVVAGTPPEWQACELPPQRSDKIVEQRTLFVVQSPLRIDPSTTAGATAEDQLRDIVSAWAKKHGLPHDKPLAWANVGVRFGWSRVKKQRLAANYVVLPGSVFSLPGGLDPQKVAGALQEGIGTASDRQQGYGAVSIHPGKAVRVFKPNENDGRVVTGDNRRRNAVQVVLRLAKAAEREGRLPSTSQIRAVEQRVVHSGVASALEYLEKQKKRTTRVWAAWEPIHQEVATLLGDNRENPHVVQHALELLANLALVATKEEIR